MDLNFYAIAVSAVAFQMLGALWWSPLLFGKPWMRALGLTRNDIDSPETNMAAAYGVSALMSVTTAFGLAVGFEMLSVDSVAVGIAYAFAAWLCFNATGRIKARMFDESPWTILLITDGYELVGYLVMGAILSGWQ